jgi:hypothetical protein
MPCYTTITTQLMDAATIKLAANKLGLRVVDRNGSITLVGNNAEMTLEKARGAQYFTTKPYSNSGNWEEKLLKPLTAEYTKQTVKSWASKNGYAFSIDRKSGEYLLTQY